MSIYDGHPGIKADQFGIRASVTVGSGADKRQKVKRFPRGVALKTITDWQDRTRVALRDGPIAARQDTLAADAARYLAHQKVQLVKSSYASLVCEINAWLPDLGPIARDQITRAQVMELRHRWLTEPRGGSTARKGTRDAQPHAPKTCNHRVRALRGLYHFLDGSKAPTPCDDIAKLTEPAPDPKFVSPATVLTVLGKLTDAKTRARLMVLASTGQRPSQLMRALPDDVDLVRGYWFVRAGKGGNPIPIKLTGDMIVAFQVFAAAEAWGVYDNSDHAKRLRAAGWPEDVRPYNTKHTVAITFAESGADFADMRDWFGHQDEKSTRIYTGHILSRSTQMAERLTGRFGWTAASVQATSAATSTATTGSRQGRDGSRLVKNRRNLSQAENGPIASVSTGKR
jgi:integrase